jgi:hypothetical protein
MPRQKAANAGRIEMRAILFPFIFDAGGTAGGHRRLSSGELPRSLSANSANEGLTVRHRAA